MQNSVPKSCVLCRQKNSGSPRPYLPLGPSWLLAALLTSVKRLTVLGERGLPSQVAIISFYCFQPDKPLANYGYINLQFIFSQFMTHLQKYCY